MGRGIIGRDNGIVPPSVAPAVSATASSGLDREEHWSNFDSSVNAVSFGFVATAILISMFLVMAIFERFLRSRSSAAGGRNSEGSSAQMAVNGKFNHPSPKMAMCGKEVSVLMPGEAIPTFIAHPAPAPCPPESISRDFLQENTFLVASSSSLPC